MSAPRPFRFGLIGSRWGINYLRTVARHPEWDIPLVARATPQPLADPFSSIPVTTQWHDLADPAHQMDAIIIATPPATHVEMAAFFIEHGIPVLIEKPLCFDPDQARSIIDLATRRHVTAWVDHTHLFHPAFRRLKELLKGQTLLAIRSQAGNDGPYRTDTSPYWDWLPHDVAMILDLCGATPLRVMATCRARRETEQGRGEAHDLHLEFPGGLTTHTSISNMELPKCRWMEVETADSIFRYDGLAEQTLTRRARTSPPAEAEALPVAATPPLDLLLHEFVAAVKNHDTSNTSLQLSRHVIEILDRGLKVL